MDKLLTSIFRPKSSLILFVFLLFTLNACKIAAGNPNWHYTPDNKISPTVANELQALSHANYVSPETKAWINELVYQDCARRVEKFGMADCFTPRLTPPYSAHTFVD